MAGQTYWFQPSASDPDSTRLSFRVRNLPAWANFDGSTGALRGTPPSGSVGTYSNIEVRVTDGKNWAGLPVFSITVAPSKVTDPTVPDPPAPAPANNAPTISGSPATSVTAGQLFAFRPTASDADSDSLTFSIQGQPAWATFDSSNGSLYGTPAIADAGVSPEVVISVSDGQASANLPAFSVTVEQPTVVVPVNQAPTISGSPVTTARVSQPYAFRPTAADADGDRLTFGIQGKPTWATFDSADGTLYGTPSATDVKVFSGVVINASDGTSAVSLPAFDIAVAAAPTSSVKVSWHPPSTNVDGTPVTDLAGYRVFYGNAAGQYDYNLLVSSPDVTSVVIEGLATATTWHFVAKSVSASGVESAYSTSVSKAL